MDNKKKTRRIKMMVFSAFMMPFMAIGAGLAAREASIQPEDDVQTVHEGDYCSASGPSTAFTGYAAENSHYYEQPDFVGDYFKNLTEHFPTNNCGNCGYTAAAMLLCYYDTYWNGHIIPDQFNSAPAKIDDPSNREYSSPGVYDFAADIELDENKKPKKDAPQSEWDAYNVYLVDEVYGPYLYEMRKQEHLKDNLISFLYDLALGNNKSQTVLWHFGVKEPTTETTPYLVKNLLNLYFSELNLSGLIEAKLVEYSDYAGPRGTMPEETQRRMLRNAAVKRLRKGQPIIYKGDLLTDSGYYDKNRAYISDSGHAGIAYGYDRECDHIIGHIGWKGEKEYSNTVFEKAFGDFDSFIYLDVNPEMQFTYVNKRYNVGNYNYICACDLKPHIHADGDHRAMVDYGDPEYHALQCICGDVEYEEHFFDELASVNAQTHALRCECGAIDHYEAHSYVEVEPCDAQYHALKCECGDVTYEEHSSEKAVYHDPQKHAYKCRCGEIVGYGFHYYFQTSLTTAKCGVCGDVKHIDPPFIINR